MKEVWYDTAQKRLVVDGSPPWALPKVYMGERSELEIKIMRREIERGTFNIEDWK